MLILLSALLSSLGARLSCTALLLWALWYLYSWSRRRDEEERAFREALRVANEGRPPQQGSTSVLDRGKKRSLADQSAMVILIGLVIWATKSLLDYALQPETVATPLLLALIAAPFSIYAHNQRRDQEAKTFREALRAANEGATPFSAWEPPDPASRRAFARGLRRGNSAIARAPPQPSQ
jgi:hypothetical protein